MEKEEIALNKNKIKRPLIITIICCWTMVAFLFAFLGLLIPEIRSQFIQQFGKDLLFSNIFLASLHLIGLVGYWKMRKWGVYLLLISFIISLIGTPSEYIRTNILGFFVPVFVILVGFLNFKKMT